MKGILLLLLSISVMQFASAQQKKKPARPPKVDITKFKPPVRDPFYIRNPDVERVSWSNENRINVFLKSGVSEKCYLDQPAQKDAFIKRFGEPPTVPPPPPPKAPKSKKVT